LGLPLSPVWLRLCANWPASSYTVTPPLGVFVCLAAPLRWLACQFLHSHTTAWRFRLFGCAFALADFFAAKSHKAMQPVAGRLTTDKPCSAGF